MFKIVILIILLFIFLLKFKINVSVKKNIRIKIYIFKVIKIFDNQKDIKWAEEKGIKIAKIEIENYIKHIEFTNIKLFLKNLYKLLNDIKVKKLDLFLNVNTNNYILNAYIVSFIYSILSMIVSKRVNQIDMNNLYYNITSNENKTKFEFECIITAKFTNIIIKLVKVMYYLIKLKKKGNDKNGKRTSNRKFDGNSNVFIRNNG